MNKLLATSARIIINGGIKMMQTAFGVPPKSKIMASDVLLVAKKILPKLELSSFDIYAYLAPIQVWKDFTEFDWAREKKYLEDIWDCDNYAMAYCSHISEILDISSFRFYGIAYNAQTGKKIGYHYWAGAVTNDPDGKHLWFIEPQNGLMAEVKSPNNIIMGEMRYEPVKIYIS